MGKKLLELSGKLGPIFALALVTAIFAAWEPGRFLSPINIGNIISQTVVIAVGAVGMTFIIVSGGIDLSAGSLIALSGVFATMAMLSAESIVVGLLAGLFTGAACGMINGLVITKGKLPPFIVTLGMLEILRGTALQVTLGLPVERGIPEWFNKISNAALRVPLTGETTIVIPYLLFILIPVALAAGFLLRYTVFGVQVYAVGSNEQTARLCGVNVERVKIWVYTLGGIAMGLAGILQASRLRSGQPTTAVGLELDIIAAVVVGGGSLMGGEGTIFGSVVGAFIIRILRNGCVIVGISPHVQRIIIGLIIIAAVFADQLRRRTLEGGRKGT